MPAARHHAGHPRHFRDPDGCGNQQFAALYDGNQPEEEEQEMMRRGDFVWSPGSSNQPRSYSGWERTTKTGFWQCSTSVRATDPIERSKSPERPCVATHMASAPKRAAACSMA